MFVLVFFCSGYVYCIKLITQLFSPRQSLLSIVSYTIPTEWDGQNFYVAYLVNTDVLLNVVM